MIRSGDYPAGKEGKEKNTKMDKTKIIVVEDNIVYCEYVTNLLAREGFPHHEGLPPVKQRRNICNRQRMMI